MSMGDDKVAEQTAIISLASSEIQGIARDMSAENPVRSEDIRQLCDDIQKANRRLILFLQQ